MSTTANEQLHNLCAQIFGQQHRLGAPIFTKGDTEELAASNPLTQDVYFIQRRTVNGGPVFGVRWIPKGKQTHKSLYATDELEGKKEPPPALLKGLKKALAYPSEHYWGVVEAGQICEIVLFTRLTFNEWKDDQRPLASLLVRRDKQQKNVVSGLNRDWWFDLEVFWQLVHNAKLRALEAQLRSANDVRLGFAANGCRCMVVDGILFAPPHVWEDNPTLTPADLRGTREFFRS